MLGSGKTGAAPPGRRSALASALAAAQQAQDVVEYGLIIGTIALVVLLGTIAFGKEIQPWIELLAGRITTTGT